MAHILLIDDDEQFRGMLSQMLLQDNHKVAVAVDGEEGLRLALQLRPDLIVTDILMPRKDGIETIMALAAAGSTIPVIAISGGRRSISADFNLESATLVGVKATLAKPFARNDLREAIMRALGALS
ncbi:MAG TPA: response regulator [Rhodocyclaceae bacterium]|nr:response regulator [Rhodocyclaceae bacterium]